VFFCVVIAALISGQLLAQDTDTTPANKTKTQAEIKKEKSDRFIQKLNATLMRENSLYPKRVECIVEKLEKEDVYEKLGESSFLRQLSEGDSNSFEADTLEELKEEIDNASFSCTIVGYCAIAMIVIVMVIVVSCVSCLSRKK
jgi:hypothetical protein